MMMAKRKVSIHLGATAALLTAMGPAACAFDASAPETVQIACVSNDDCPRDWFCDGVVELCVTSEFSDGAPQNPNLQISPIQHFRGAIDVDLALAWLSDPNANNGDETVQLEAWVSLDGNPDPKDNVYEPITLLGWDTALPADATATESTIVWSALADAIADALKVQPRLNLATTFVDTTGDGTAETQVVSHFAAPAVVRLVARDSSGLESELSYVDLSFGNDAPVVELSLRDPPYTGDVPIGLLITDTASDPVTLEVQFRINGETDWRRAANAFAEYQHLSTQPEGSTYAFVWNSLVWLDADLTYGQGVGSQTVDVDIRARVIDNATGVPHYGLWATTPALVTIQN